MHASPLLASEPVHGRGGGASMHGASMHASPLLASEPVHGRGGEPVCMHLHY